MPTVSDRMPGDRVSLFLLALALAAYFGLDLAYDRAIPRWNEPDEPAHFNYARELAASGQLPVLHDGDFPAAYLEDLKRERFPAGRSISVIRYEAHQPPLYYGLVALALRPFLGLPLNGEAQVARAISILLGALGVVGAWLLARLALPGDALSQGLAAAFVALVPVRSAITSAVSNDVLAEVMTTALALGALLYLRRGPSRWLVIALGGALGLGVLTKVSVATAALPLALAVVGRWRLDEYGRKEVWRCGGASSSPLPHIHTSIRPHLLALASVLAIALALCSWWLARNALVYGGWDLFGLRRQGEVTAAQAQLSSFGPKELSYFVVVTFHSFWAQFGWMGVLVPPQVYAAFQAVTLLPLAGLLLGVSRALRGVQSPKSKVQSLEPPRRPWTLDLGLWTWFVLALFYLTVLAGDLAYNLRYVQPQGRYLFPAMGAIAVFFALGVRELTNRRWQVLTTPAMALTLLGLNVLCLTRYVWPYFR